jgi:thymus-specific serine protease
VQRTNIRYGGFNPTLTNVYFTNGDLDPWHPNSVLEDLNESVLSTILPFSAHVSDLGQIADYDSPEKRASKEKIQILVKKWLGTFIESE